MVLEGFVYSLVSFLMGYRSLFFFLFSVLWPRQPAVAIRSVTFGLFSGGWRSRAKSIPRQTALIEHLYAFKIQSFAPSCVYWGSRSRESGYHLGLSGYLCGYSALGVLAAATAFVCYDLRGRGGLMLLQKGEREIGFFVCCIFGSVHFFLFFSFFGSFDSLKRV